MESVRFVCERCQMESAIKVKSDESVYAVCEGILTEHIRNSPSCTGDLSTIKLLGKRPEPTQAG